ncbi:MAG: acetoin utilization protein AcuC [Deltaproteobacteria bacterium]|nr:acetoin utilization protein AcuC [Deltaproteobacteria bacterium]
MATPPAPPAPAFVYTREYLDFDYGPNHPLRIDRLGMVIELIEACGLAQPPHPVNAATTEELAVFHDRRYLELLKELSADPASPDCLSYGLGSGDNPVFPGLYDWSALCCGASLAAMRLVSQGGHQVAFNIAGGMHHALAGRAAGFCYLNDPVVAAKHLVNQGRRVLYLDLDAHHGDGVQWAFYDTDQVLTMSFHQHPATLFPGTGYAEEMGRGKGRGYSVNVPLWPDCDDEIYMFAFEKIFPPVLAAFQPDYVITQLGVDTFMADPLANLNLTTRGFLHCLSLVRELCLGRWIATGGGGYHPINVARGWTAAWAVMLGREKDLPEFLPAGFAAEHRLPADECRLLDVAECVRGRFWNRSRRDAEELVKYLEDTLFPLLGAKPV